jgi:hypothetical protein
MIPFDIAESRTLDLYSRISFAGNFSDFGPYIFAFTVAVRPDV